MPDWSEIDYVIYLRAAIFAALSFVFFFAVKVVVQAIARRLDMKGMAWPALILGVARKTTMWFLVALAARLTTRYTELQPAFEQAVGFIFIVAAALQFAIWTRAFILGLVERRTATGDGDDGNLGSAVGLIRIMVSVVVFAIAGIVILDNLGVDVTGLVAGLGIGGIAIGLAAQGIFSDLFAALSIILDKPFRVGDTITFNGKEGSVTGKVEEIGLKSTRIRSLTGELRVIGNAQLLTQELTNYTGRSMYRLHLPVGVTYQTAPDVAMSIPDLMMQLTEDAGYRFIRSNFTGFGPSSIDFELYFEADVDNVADAQKAHQEVALGLLRTFNERGIEFAYPTQTNFFADPDGKMVMPYAQGESASHN